MAGPVRVGVDVGGTFTKAVACDAASGRIVARCVVPTTHDAPLGVAEGLAGAIAGVAAEVARIGQGPIRLVSHSTTQAVNALIEGDTALVGVLGIGRRPDLGRVARRTRIGAVRLAPGRNLRTVHALVDASDGLDRRAVETAVVGLRDAGAAVICASEAFGVEDPAGERLALEVAADLGLPACAGHELSGLYGLELRTVTAALNASILPSALATARVVEDAAARAAPGAPLLVMRGDGGAADFRSIRRRPLLTAFSGPAASVAGALRHVGLHEGVVVEVGGTSTNVSAVRGGRPILAYVRVLDHLTHVRSLDVRVAGVAGGSLLRIGRRLGRARIEAVGPRSAHIAGLPYAAFLAASELAGAELALEAPRPGDPPAYAVLRLMDGRRAAITLTCAANALGLVPAEAYAAANREAARLAFVALARSLGGDWAALARRVIELASGAVAAIVEEVVDDLRLSEPELVGLGGGAGALVPSLGARLRLPWRIPPDAEVISSVGDALSLVRVELERSLPRVTPEVLGRLQREAEEAAIEAGAAPETLIVETETVAERRAVRLVATGSVTLDPGATAPLSDEALRHAAAATLKAPVRLVGRGSRHTVFSADRDGQVRFVVLDQAGGIAARGDGWALAGTAEQVAQNLRDRLPRLVRHVGPISVAPTVRLVRGPRLVDLSLLSAPGEVLEAALGECALAGGEPVVALVSRT